VWDGADLALVLAAPLLWPVAAAAWSSRRTRTLTSGRYRDTAGLAAGFYETGQRIGTGLGTTLASAAILRLAGSEPTDYPGAAGLGLAIAATLAGWPL